MKVVELKQIVDANAVEMRAGFARVDARLNEIQGDMGQIQGDMGQMKGEMGQMKREMGQMKGEMGQMKGEMGQMKGEMGLMREEMARMSKRIDDRAAESNRHLAVFAEQIVDNFRLVVDDLEARVDRKIDEKIAASEARLTRKFSKR